MRLNLIIIIATASGCSLWANDLSKPDDAVTFAASNSRWSVSAGAAAQAIGASFRMARPAPVSSAAFGQSLFNDPGLYRGGAGTVHYADGQMGPDYNSVFSPHSGPSGDALGIINNASQVSPNVRTEQTFGTPIAELSFHSTQVASSSMASGALHPFGAADSDVGVAAGINFAYELTTSDKDSLSVAFGWSRVQSNPGSGQPILSTQSVTQHQSQINHTYVYDYDQASGTAANPGAAFPFNAQGNPATAGYIIYNPALYSGQAGGDGFLAPRESSRPGSSSTRTATAVAAVTGLRVTLNELDFTAQFERTLLPWLHVGVSAGPTVNIVSSSFDSQVNWYMAGQSAPVAQELWHEDKTQVKAGFMGQLNAQADLTPRVFVECHGGYRWVDAAGASSGPAAASLKLSSWTGGVDIGIRF